jgi:hypothetical protein
MKFNEATERFCSFVLKYGGSSDRTRAIVEAEARQRLKVAPKGRTVQMNTATRLARGEWLLLLHADTLLPEGALCRLNRLEDEAALQTVGAFTFSMGRCLTHIGTEGSFEFRGLCF